MAARAMNGVHHRRSVAPTRDRGILLIACFKLLKAALLIALGVGALRLLDAGTREHLVRLLETVSLPTGRRLIEAAIRQLQSVTPARVNLVAAGALIYGLLFGVEGIGLWRARRWAEYLTVIGTSLLLPLEIYELVRGFGLLKLAALIGNAAIVIYLVYRLRRRLAET